jgi:hypothetical protein
MAILIDVDDAELSRTKTSFLEIFLENYKIN